MGEIKSTPTPWFVATASRNGITIRGQDREGGSLPVAEIWHTVHDANANAALIVRAVNRDALFNEAVEALEEARGQIEYLHDKFAPTGTGATTLARIDAVLAKAREASK